jgi:hypothetical protein
LRHGSKGGSNDCSSDGSNDESGSQTGDSNDRPPYRGGGRLGEEDKADRKGGHCSADALGHHDGDHDTWRGMRPPAHSLRSADDLACIAVAVHRFAGHSTTELSNWYEDLGVPIILTRGYGSQTYVDDIAEIVDRNGRPAILVYAVGRGPLGEDIPRDLGERCDGFGFLCFAES